VDTKKFPVLIRCCWFGINHLFREKIFKIPLTTVQYTVLRTIYDSLQTQLNQRELALLISTNQNNLSSILNRLEDMKYIKIVGNPFDKRENQIKLTEIGKKIFLDGRKKAEDLQKGITQALKHSDMIELSEYLTRINKNIPD
jgi:DNA-binding MarR family transcriptional regulator